MFKIKISRFLFLHGIIFFTGGYLHVSAQADDPLGKVSIASPTAASLGKYGDIPVGYHTGTPQIDVPIYTVKSGKLSLPIGLSYHASGIKVQEPSSWVGTAWSLNAGGVITRTVEGGPDENGTNTAHTETNGHFSDYGYNNYLSGNGMQQDWLSFARGYKDGEPDLFFFNFNGHSGKFYFRDDRTPVLVPETDMKIVPYYPGTGNSIQGFVITTSDGVQYYFGNSPGVTGTPPIEITSPVNATNGTANATAISSWYLNKIVSADGIDNITFSYQPENYGYFTLSMFPLDQAQNTSTKNEYDLVKNIVQGVRLSQISFANGTVNFIAGAVRTDLSDNTPSLIDNDNLTATSLAAIQVTDGSAFCKKYNFSYSYFSDNTSPLTGYLAATGGSSYNLHTDQQRLRLDSVSEISCDGSISLPPHKFTYFSEMVPRRLSFGIDHWGFYNGVTTNQTLIPTYTVSDGTNVTTYNGANRDAGWPAMRCGTLQTITYPTGGTTTFNFEPHNVYTNYPVYQQVSLTSLVAHEYGQSQLSMTSSFTITAPGSCIITVNNNSSNWSPSFFIKNSSNVDQIPWSLVNSSTTFSLSLPPGTYTTTLSFPSNAQSTITGGADVTINQWQYQAVVNTVMVGGLRISSITNNDGISPGNNITSYSYLNGNQSTGVLFSRPAYVSIIRNDLIQNIGYWTAANGFLPCTQCSGYGCISGPFASYLISPSSIQPMATTQGNHIGYSQVKVLQSGNGYSIYNYYGAPPYQQANISDVAIRTVNTSVCDATVPSYPFAPLPFDYMRGELQHEAHYNEAGQLLKEASYTPVYVSSTVNTPAFKVSWTRQGQQLLATSYNLVSARKTQMQTVGTDYTPGVGSITRTSTIYFGSPYHHQPTLTTTTNSAGDLLQTKNTYAFDFRIAACDAIADGYPQYTTDCASCLTAYNNDRYACGGASSCLTTAYLNYMQCQTTARINYVNYQRNNFTNSINTFVTNHTTAKNVADAELKPILELQDAFNNPVIETTSWKNNNLLHAGFTRYDYGVNPANIVYPNKTQLINLQAASAFFTNTVVSGNTITKDSRYQDENLYTIQAGNIREATQKNGVTMAYVWDYLNNCPTASVSNAVQSDIAYTSFEADGQGNWSFSGSATPDLSAPTGNNCYNLNNGSISKYGLSTSNSYIVSYWSKSGSIYTISGSTSVKQGKTINGWTFFEHTVAGTNAITVSGGNFIDELRLYPVTAQMTTYTYTPLLGITSQCDADNRISYYQYDVFGRLKMVKDQDGNIIKTIGYYYKNQADQ